jgi:hypothetical protein|tara:strand:+ start:963 stop:1199 length:237 start_codon:yes stop_codon:yes gene_type:complete
MTESKGVGRTPETHRLLYVIKRRKGGGFLTSGDKWDKKFSAARLYQKRVHAEKSASVVREKLNEPSAAVVSCDVFLLD